MSTTTLKPAAAKTPNRFAQFKAALRITPLTAEQEQALQAKRMDENAAKQRKAQANVDKQKEKLRKAEQKLGNKRTEAQAHYDRLLKEARECAEALSGLRGATGQLQLLDQGIRAAETTANDGKYDEAKAMLETLKATSLRDKGLAAENGAAKNAETQFPEIYTIAAKMKNDLAAFPISKTQVDAITGEIDQVMSPLKAPDADADIAATVKERLLVVNEKVVDGRIEGETARKRFLDALADGQPALKALAGTVSDPELSPLQRDLDMAKQFAQTKDFALAADLAERVVTRVDAARTAAETGKANWDKLGKALTGVIAKAVALDQNTSPILVGREPTAKAILATLRTVEDQGAEGDIGKRVPYAQASDAVAEALRQLTTLESLLTAGQGIEQDRKDARFKVANAIEGVEVSLVTMRGAVAEAVGNANAKDSDGEFGRRLDAIRTAWQGTAQRAATVDELETDATLLKLDKLNDEIDAVIADPAKQFAAYRDQLFDVARTKFDAAAKQCETALAAMFELSDRDALIYQAQLDKGRAAVQIANRPGNVDTETKSVDALVLKVNGLVTGFKTGMTDARSRADASLNKAAAALKQFETEIANVKDSQKHNPLRNDAAVYTPHLEALREQYDQLAAVVPASDLGGLNEANRDLDLLTAAIAAASAALKRGRDEDGNSVVTLASLKDDVAKLRGKCDRKDFRTYLAVTQAKLIDTADDLTTKIATLQIPEAVAQLEALDQSYQDAKAALATSQSDYEAFKKTVAKFRKLMAQFKDQFKDATDAYASFDSRTKACESMAMVEGELQNARTKLDEVLIELQKALTDPASIAAMQTGIDAAKDKANTDAARFKGQYDSFKQTLASYGEIKSKDRKDIQALAESAKKDFDKSHDFDSAMIKLQAAAQRADVLHKYPEGAAMAARNNLPKVVARWKTAVANFTADLAKLETSIDAIEDLPEYAAAKSAASKTVADLRPLFNPNAFDAAIAKMTAKNAPQTAKTAGREDGLRWVRRYNAYIDKDFRFLELSKNPFVDGLAADLVAAHLALADLEHNLLISL